MTRPHPPDARGGTPTHPRPSAAPRARRPRAHAHLTLTGVALPDDATRVRDALLTVAGALTARVDLGGAHAIITYDPRATLPDRLTDAVQRAGLAALRPYRARITHIDTQE